MMTSDRQNKILGICASIGVHAVAAAFLLFGLSGPAALSNDPGKLNLMWVTLAVKEAKAFLPADRLASRGRETVAAGPAAKEEAKALQDSRRAAPAGAAVSSTSVNARPGEIPAASAVSREKGGKPNASDGIAGEAGGESAMVTRALPLYRENPPPGYPAIARQRGYQGVVLVEAEILPDGHVGSAEVRKTSGYAILDHAAVSAVKGWKFEPARKSGVPCKAKAQLPIKFILNDHRSQS